MLKFKRLIDCMYEWVYRYLLLLYPNIMSRNWGSRFFIFFFRWNRFSSMPPAIVGRSNRMGWIRLGNRFSLFIGHVFLLRSKISESISGEVWAVHVKYNDWVSSGYSTRRAVPCHAVSFCTMPCCAGRTMPCRVMPCRQMKIAPYLPLFGLMILSIFFSSYVSVNVDIKCCVRLIHRWYIYTWSKKQVSENDLL